MDLPDGKASRVTFNEITKKVVTESIAAPREIDQNLVDAQQARRILDRIVAMNSPPAVEKDPPGPVRRAGAVRGHPAGGRAGGGDPGFVPQEYWTLEVTLDRVAPNQGSFKTQFYGREKKMELKSQEDVDQVLAAIRTAPFSVSKIKRQDKNRAPAPPFITSTLQQEPAAS